MTLFKKSIAIGLVVLWFVPIYQAGGPLESGFALAFRHGWLWMLPAAGGGYLWSVWAGRNGLQLVSILILTAALAFTVTVSDGISFAPVPVIALTVFWIGALAVSLEDFLRRRLGESMAGVAPTLAVLLSVGLVSPVYFAFESDRRVHNKLYLHLAKLPALQTALKRDEVSGNRNSGTGDVANGTVAVVSDPAPAEAPLRGVAGPDVAIDQQCLLSRTTIDDGWSLLAPGQVNFHQIHWQPSAEYWAITTSDGELFQSRTDGRVWEFGQCRKVFRFEAVHFLGVNSGWAVGALSPRWRNNGAVARTEDGGSTWQVRELPRPISVQSPKYIHFWNARQGIVIGPNHIVVTTDGGKSWQASKPGGSENDIRAAGFGKALDAWIYDHGRPAKLYRTHDGGVNWEAAPSLPASVVQDDSGLPGISRIGPLDPKFVLIVDRRHRLYATHDDGKTWKHMNPAPDAGTGKVVAARAFDAHAAVAYVVGSQGGMYATHDGGRFWNPLFSKPADKLVMGVEFSGSRRGVRWSQQGLIERTDDGGKNWSPVGGFVPDSLWGVRFPDARTGWVYGENGRVLHTRDGGQTWIWLQSPIRDRIISGSFPVSWMGWLLADNGSIVAVGDNGIRWKEQRRESDQAQRWREIQMLNGERGWVVGDRGKILTTEDGGAKWTLRETLYGENLNSVHFVDLDWGWAVGERGLVLHSRDGGRTWKDQPLPTGMAFSAVHFVDHDYGWVVGSERTGYRTSDGGQNWSTMRLPDDKPFRAVRFFDRLSGWIVGSSAWYRTRDGGVNWIKVEPPSGVLGRRWRQPQSGWFVNADAAIGVGPGGQVWRFEAKVVPDSK